MLFAWKMLIKVVMLVIFFGMGRICDCIHSFLCFVSVLRLTWMCYSMFSAVFRGVLYPGIVTDWISSHILNVDIFIIWVVSFFLFLLCFLLFAKNQIIVSVMILRAETWMCGDHLLNIRSIGDIFVLDWVSDLLLGGLPTFSDELFLVKSSKFSIAFGRLIIHMFLFNINMYNHPTMIAPLFLSSFWGISTTISIDTNCLSIFMS